MPFDRKGQIRSAKIEAVRSRTGSAVGLIVREPVSRNPDTRRPMTRPSVSRRKATAWDRNFLLQRLLQLALQKTQFGIAGRLSPLIGSRCCAGQLKFLSGLFNDRPGCFRR